MSLFVCMACLINTLVLGRENCTFDSLPFRVMSYMRGSVPGWQRRIRNIVQVKSLKKLLVVCAASNEWWQALDVLTKPATQNYPVKHCPSLDYFSLRRKNLIKWSYMIFNLIAILRSIQQGIELKQGRYEERTQKNGKKTTKPNQKK